MVVAPRIHPGSACRLARFLFPPGDAALRVFVQSRGDTALQILALRQQVAVLRRQHPRPPLHACDRLFLTILHRLWPHWSEVLLIVKPATVIAWHVPASASIA